MKSAFCHGILVLSLMLLSGQTCAQSASAIENAKALRRYMAPAQVSRLDWELVQFNLLWAGSFSSHDSYLTSFPVVYEERQRRFRAIFGISETRNYQDPDRWSSMPRMTRESILLAAADQLSDLLAQTFPEVKSTRGLIYIEFKYRPKGGAHVNAAKYENGVLTLLD